MWQRENAAINGILPDHFTALTGNVLDQNAMPSFLAQGQYDVVLANIVADVIIPMAPVVPQFLKPNRIFICSGILKPGWRMWSGRFYPLACASPSGDDRRLVPADLRQPSGLEGVLFCESFPTEIKPA